MRLLRVLKPSGSFRALRTSILRPRKTENVRYALFSAGALVKNVIAAPLRLRSAETT